MKKSKITKEEYNNITVFYCKKCLSLRIRTVDGIDFCDKCGGTDLEESTIEEWIKLKK